jgi:[protein-PII] uridylyltransferase
MNTTFLNEIEVWHRKGYTGRLLAEKYTQTIDLLIEDIVNSSHPGTNTAIIAVGGYGREELAPFSDVDIMFFISDRKDTEKAKAMLYKLWDTGIDISYSFRTSRECIDEAFKDVRTRTSLLEARFVAGDKLLYAAFREKVYPEIAHKKQKDFVREKLKEMDRRHLDSGDSIFLLEPHLKEGEGGLRDVHTAYWLSKVALKIEKISEFSGLMSYYEYKRFLNAYDFLLRTRFSLHLASGRKNDILSFEYQKQVADGLGFKDSRKFKASERFLRYYYLKTGIIKEITRKIMVLCSRPYVSVRRDMSIKRITEEFVVSGGNLITTKKDLFASRPEKIIEGFYLYSKTGRKFSDALKEHISLNLLRIRRARSSPEAIHYFLEILRDTRVYETLREMHETGVLGRFIPEFGALRHLVVHEPYHMFTVDEHTLHAIRNLEELRDSRFGHLEPLHRIFIEVKDIDTLFLAILFHDIGKAAGRHHEEEGYKRLKNIMERFNLDVKKRTKIEFLVKNHILMSKIALRSEASDNEVVARFADAVGDPENLKAIYLVTYADMSAVNPGFWTSWKSYLLMELYAHTMDYLVGIRADRAEYIRSIQSYSPGIAMQGLIDFLEEMPERYLLSTTRGKIVEDYKLMQRVKESGFAMRIDGSSEGFAELSISAEDCPGLFARIVGFLSSRGLNIVNGRIFTGRKGIVIDKISISNWKDLWWDGLEGDIKEGLRGIIVDGKPVNIVRRQKKAEGPFDIFIELDNEASDEFSVIEIFSQDRLGLLYDISHVLYKQGINIVSARINTEAGLAQDVFYTQAKKDKIDYVKAQEVLAKLWDILKK